MFLRRLKLKLRFSLRSLIAVFLLSGIAFAAFHYRLRDAEQQSATVSRLKRFGGYVRYKNHYNVISKPKAESKLGSWLTQQLGVDFFHDIDTICVSGRGELTDSDFCSICDLRNVRSVRLGKTVVTDEALRTATALDGLEMFSISSPHITDEGMKHISQMRDLERLSLINTNITDVGLAKLACLANLEYLSLRKTKVSPAGVTKLRKALPDCKIVFHFDESLSVLR